MARHKHNACNERDKTKDGRRHGHKHASTHDKHATYDKHETYLVINLLPCLLCVADFVDGAGLLVQLLVRTYHGTVHAIVVCQQVNKSNRVGSRGERSYGTHTKCIS